MGFSTGSLAIMRISLALCIILSCLIPSRFAVADGTRLLFPGPTHIEDIEDLTDSNIDNLPKKGWFELYPVGANWKLGKVIFPVKRDPDPAWSAMMAHIVQKHTKSVAIIQDRALADGVVEAAFPHPAPLIASTVKRQVALPFRNIPYAVSSAGRGIYLTDGKRRLWLCGQKGSVPCEVQIVWAGDVYHNGSLVVILYMRGEDLRAEGGCLFVSNNDREALPFRKAACHYHSG